MRHRILTQDGKISRGLKELELAEKLNAEHTESIRKATLAEAAEIIEKEAKSAGAFGSS